MPGYPGAGLYKQGTELGELVSLGLSDAGSIPAASTIFPPFTPRPARRPSCRRAGLFFAPPPRYSRRHPTPLRFYSGQNHKPRTTRTTRTRRSRQYKLSRLGFQRTLRFTFPPSLSGTSSGLQGTLRLKIMNREKRELYEQGEADYTNFRG